MPGSVSVTPQSKLHLVTLREGSSRPWHTTPSARKFWDASACGSVGSLTSLGQCDYCKESANPLLIFVVVVLSQV